MSDTLDYPCYINIPIFLINSDLPKSAMVLAGYFYSLHTAGMSIYDSNKYLAAMLNVSEQDIKIALDNLEKQKYIERSIKNSVEGIKWIFNVDKDSEIKCLD